MHRNVAAIGLLVVVAGCGQAQAGPTPSIPPAPAAPAGWTSLASAGSTEGPGFAGLQVDVSGRPLALNVVCVGIGTLVVTLGDPQPATGQQAVTFPCSMDASVSMRFDIPTPAGAGQVSVAGGIVPGLGALSPSAFVISVEEANP